MKRFLSLLLVLAALVLVTSVVWALPGPLTIDGDPADWSDATCLVDTGGADDETSPASSDITEFCAHVDGTYIYVAMVWDNTRFTSGGITSGSRVDVNADGLADYFILATMTGNPAVLSSYSVGSCTAGSCTNTNDICDNCAAVLADGSALWPDPFGARAGSVCTGTDCTLYDGFVEMAVPWSLLGLAGPPSPHVFGDFNSYPSGPAQAPKDTVADGNGISCDANGNCWVSGPTAVNVSALGASAGASLALPLAAGVLLLAVGTVWALRRRGENW